MTNELEKLFFDTFGIEKELNTCEIGKYGKCPSPKSCVDTCPNFKSTKFYPQITDRILLELICIDNQENIYKCRPLANNAEELKTYILEEFIRLYELGLFKRVHQVQALFEEG